MKKGTLALGAAFAAAALVAAAPPAVPPAEPAPAASPAPRPVVVLAAAPYTVAGGSATVSGVVFSSVPVDSVLVGGRPARLRPPTAQDMEKLRRVPEGATEAPQRVFFEAQGVPLPTVGVNEIEIEAMAGGARSLVHRLTIIRASAAGPSK